MEKVVTVGLDVAKSVFQVHGVDAGGRVVVRQKLSRAKLIAFFEKLAVRCHRRVLAENSSHAGAWSLAFFSPRTQRSTPASWSRSARSGDSRR